MSRNVRSLLALVVLTLFLGTSAAHALPPEGRGADGGPGMLAAVWEWVASLIEGRAPFVKTHDAVGGTVPPVQSGTNGNGNGDPDGEFGGFIDPFG